MTETANTPAARPVNAESRVVLIDGSGFIFRAFHALPPLTRASDGLPIGAVSGFCNMLFKLVEDSAKGDDRPTHLAVVFDASGPTFRTDIYPEYKANRPPAPEELIPQFPLIRDATRAFGLPCVELAGYEADDLIAAYAVQAEAAGARVTIVSSDKDLMQLVSDRVEMFDSMKNKRIQRAEVIEKFGAPPEKVIDIQALAGDTSDNIPGAPGIGVKTAAKLLEEYGDLDGLLARAGEIKQPKRRQTLIDFADQIRVSRRLATLDQRTPVPVALNTFGLKSPDPNPLLAFLTLMEFRTLTSRVAQKHGATPPAKTELQEPQIGMQIPPNAAQMQLHADVLQPNASQMQPDAALSISPDSYETVRDSAALQTWIDAAYETGVLAIDTETTGLNDMTAELVGVSLATDPGKACYIPLAHTVGDGDLLGATERAPNQLTIDAALAILKPILADPSVLKIGQNLKYDLKILTRYGVEIVSFDDTMLLSCAVASGLHGHGMDELSERYLDHKPIPIKELIGSGKAKVTFDKVPIEKAAPYAAEDADVTLRLWRLLKPRLTRERATTVYETLERPMVKVLADMERAGVKVDRAALSRLSGDFAQKMAALEAEIHTVAGETFNIASPKQLGEILFDRLGLTGGKKTKTGAWGTGAGVLEEVVASSDGSDGPGAELAVKVLDWRRLAKLKSTYTDALQGHVNPDTGRVHTSFSLAAASTGRLASSEPNVQNIPIRTEEGREIRKAFVAEPGNVLISLDYSQIELRVLAHMANVDALKQAFYDGQDIHAMTASAVFGVPIEGMDPMVRRQAKAINFGVIYGVSAHGLALNLRISRSDAQAFIDAYFARFPGIQAYMARTIAQAREIGYVETLFGRRVHMRGINAKGPARGGIERAAINAPIQGGAAEIIRRAMIRMPGALKQAGLTGRMLLQVHDELIFEAPDSEAQDLIDCARRIMVDAPAPALRLDVPLEADAGVGLDWGAAH